MALFKFSRLVIYYRDLSFHLSFLGNIISMSQRGRIFPWRIQRNKNGMGVRTPNRPKFSEIHFSTSIQVLNPPNALEVAT